jgi:excisionase family DNA binding protein
LWTVAEAAEFLHLNKFTVYRMASRRKIPVIRIGRALRFDRQKIERWIEARSVSECLKERL